MCAPNAPAAGNPAARGVPNVQGRTPASTAPWSSFNSADNPDAASILDQRAADYARTNGTAAWTPGEAMSGPSMGSGLGSVTAPPGTNPAGRVGVDVQGRLPGATTNPVTTPVAPPQAVKPDVMTPLPTTEPTYSTKPLMTPLPAQIGAYPTTFRAPGGGGPGGVAGAPYSTGSTQDLVTNALMRNFQRGYY